MSTVQDIYNELFTGAAVTVRCVTFAEYETLRTSLCKKNQLQVALDLTTGSICGTYSVDKQEGTFTLGPSKRLAAADKWAIVRSE